MATRDIPKAQPETPNQGYADTFDGDIFDTDAFRPDSVGFDSSALNPPPTPG